MYKNFLLLFFFSILLFSCKENKKTETSDFSQTDSIKIKSENNDWAILPFIKMDSANPVLLPVEQTKFKCPIWKKEIHWEAHDVYNPAAIVKDGKIFLIYRAEDTLKAVNGTSRLGLAESLDGIHFKRLSHPIFYPNNDEMKNYEWKGGCEDPRIIEDSIHTYYMTYSAYDGKTARLCIATSKNLLNWTKKGLVFKNEKDKNLWSKSGSIVGKRIGDKIIAVKIKNKYWMYWGENGFLANSDDLINWKYIEDKNGEPLSVVPKRDKEEIFDSGLVEPGPPALLTEKGILLIYNGAAMKKKPLEGVETYSAGQVLMDKNDPSKIISRLNKSFIKPEKNYELNGQVNKVTFVEGLVHFNDKWFLYYGTADSKIAVAICKK